MTTPTGTIGLDDVNAELGYSRTRQISMSDAAVRDLAEQPSGSISMNDLRGKQDGIREPASGEYYTSGSQWWVHMDFYGNPANDSIYWGGTTILNSTEAVSAGSSYTEGGWTYYKGAFQTTNTSGFTDIDQHGIYRVSA